MLSEHIAQMGPMLILAGLSVAWLAEAVARAGSYGFMVDMVAALLGSILGGALVLGFFTGASMPAMLVVGCLGATAALAGQRRFWRSVRLGT